MYHTILVPLDGSPLSEEALPIACDIARRARAVLHLVHVTTRRSPAPIFVEGLPVIDEDLHSLGATHDRAYLERIADRLAVQDDLAVTVAVLDSHPTDDHEQSIPGLLASYALSCGVDLIVMTTHGRGGLARFWLGSVADALIRLSPAPILLLRCSENKQETGRSAQVQRILIPLDGSPRSEAILAHALALGKVIGAEYILLHVVVPAVLGSAAPFTTPTDLDPEQTRRDQAEAELYLDKLVERLKGTGATVRTQVLVADQVAPAILRECLRDKSDLIAISTVGRSGVRRLLIGSIADKVLRRAEVPLLLHRDDVPRGGA